MTRWVADLTVGDVSVIRGTCLLNFSDLVRERGADPAPILKRAGLVPGQEGNYEVFIPYRSLVVALNCAAEITGDLDFGRRLALRQGIEILGPVGVAARTAPTVAAALDTFNHYLSSYGPAVAVAEQSMAHPRRMFYEFRVLARDLPALAQVNELSLGVALQVFRFLMGSGYRPLQVHFPHDPLTRVEDYREYYGCTPLFAQRRAGFVLRTADLDRGLSHDQLAHHAMIRYLESVAPPSGGFAAPVRELILQLLPTGVVSLELVARHFAVHPKTLQRRLAVENTTFAGLVEQTRADLAERYLRDTDMPLTRLARELGYAEQSVLSRSCRRWFGEGPAAHRVSLRAAGASA